MKNIPTAAELAEEMFIKDKGSYSSFNRVGFTGLQLTKVAIEFAKLHVEAALKVASEKAEIHSSSGSNYYREFEEGIRNDTIWIPANSILNAYPLTNIK
jgi:hypothetical protein